LNLLCTEERYWALFYMPLYTFLHNLLNALVQIANKMGLQEKIWEERKSVRPRRVTCGKCWTAEHVVRKQ
jgi:hypothetical protein